MNEKAIIDLIQGYAEAISASENLKDPAACNNAGLTADLLLESIMERIGANEIDARRYRWLRDGNSIQIFGLHEAWTTSHRLDMVIDDAMDVPTIGESYGN